MSCHIPPLDRQTVREAVSLSIDKKEVAKAAFRFDTVPLVTDNYIPAKLPGFFPIEDKIGYDPEAARTILREEGFDEASHVLTLSLFFEQPRRDEDQKVYRALRDRLAGSGIKLKMRYYKSLEDLKSFKEPYLVMITWTMDFPDPEDIVMPLFFSTSLRNTNLLRYANPHLDELVKRAMVERSWTERISLFHKIEDILYADIPAIPLFSTQHRLALQPNVRGARIPPLGFFYLDAKEIWLAR
jgi:ABC-type transport system substrate-binding protein